MSEWTNLRLSDGIEIIGGGTPKRSEKEYWGGTIPWLSVVDFNSDSRFVSSTVERITELGLQKSSTKLLNEGQIIISARGTVGCLAQLTEPMAFNQSCYGLAGKEGILRNDFLYYLLKSKVGELKQNTHGAVFDTITRDTFSCIDISIPDLNTQQKIANTLGAIDHKIENNRRMNATLEGMAQAIFKSWFVDFDPVHAKVEALKSGGSENDARLAAMCAISGKAADALAQLKSENPNEYAQLATTADAFPSSFTDSDLGQIPEGWEVKTINDIINRLSVNKRYTKKQVEQYGKVPVYEQGASILLGYHDNDPALKASPQEPKFIFGDHTCVTHLSCHDFDISQNVIPAEGKNRPTMWVYYAIQGKQLFQEYRRHWSEFVIKDICIAPEMTCKIYADLVTSFYIKKEQAISENQSLAETRDALLPKLLSGKIDVSALNDKEETE